jgi:hypothetical protein
LKYESGHAQDLHFSQFLNSPLTQTGNTGFIPDGDYRLVSIIGIMAAVMQFPIKP